MDVEVEVEMDGVMDGGMKVVMDVERDVGMEMVVEMEREMGLDGKMGMDMEREVEVERDADMEREVDADADMEREVVWDKVSAILKKMERDKYMKGDKMNEEIKVTKIVSSGFTRKNNKPYIFFTGESVDINGVPSTQEYVQYPSDKNPQVEEGKTYHMTTSPFGGKLSVWNFGESTESIENTSQEDNPFTEEQNNTPEISPKQPPKPQIQDFNYRQKIDALNLAIVYSQRVTSVVPLPEVFKDAETILKWLTE